MYDNRHHQFEYQYNHRFGFHMNSMVPQVIDACLSLKPPVVKVIDPNVDVLKRIRANRPDTLIVYRRFFGSQPLGSTHSASYDIGKAKASELLTTTEALDLGLIDLVEGYNEAVPAWAPDHEHRQYDSFMVGFHEAFREAGFPAQPVAFNFGTGNGSAELLLRCYKETLQTYKWLGFHEYDWPTLDRLHRQGLAEGNGGKWLALRYQRIMDTVAAKMSDWWSILISECGMTQGVLDGDDLGPWAERNTIPGQSPWSKITTPIPPESYWESLLWYNDQIMADPRVAGVCLFATGATGDPKWPTFEHVPIITDKIAVYQQVIDSIPSQPPEQAGATQVYIQQAEGEFVGLESQLRAGQQITVRASGDAAGDRVFSHYTDHSGKRYNDSILVLDSGSSLSLTAHFRDKLPEPVAGRRPAWWPYNRPLIGLHGRNDYDWQQADRDLVRLAEIETVSFMGHTHTDSFAAFKFEFPDIPIITRVYSPDLQNEYFNQGKRPSPDVYVQQVRNDIISQGPYCQIFRIHNEPNHLHEYEGWGSDADQAQDFNAWFIAVVGQLRREFPQFRFLFPNLAQGDAHNDLGWFRACLPAIKASDGWCASCYWQNFSAEDQNHLSKDWGLRFTRYASIASEAGITRPAFIVESGNSNHQTPGWPPVSEARMAQELVEYYARIITDYSGVVYAVMPFLMSSPADWQSFAWREETGRFKAVVSAVGAMSRPEKHHA